MRHARALAYNELTPNFNGFAIFFLFCLLFLKGGICSEKCRRGHFGEDCSRICNCSNSPCQHETGKCQCRNGYIGER